MQRPHYEVIVVKSRGCSDSIVIVVVITIVVAVMSAQISEIIFCLVCKSAQNDWQLRGTFFDCIVGVAAYVGWQSSIILKPLLQQVSKRVPNLIIRFLSYDII